MNICIGITHVASCLPECVDDVRSWGHRTGQPARTIDRLAEAGVHCYHDARGESAMSLAAGAIGSLMAASGVAPHTVDALVYVHTLQGSVAPPPLSLPRLLCEQFGFLDADAFSFAQQHCASALGALRIIRAMFIARPAMRRVLLAGADTMPIASERLMEGAGLLADGAFAALIERDASMNRLLAMATHASGHGWRGASAHEEPRLAAEYFLAARGLITQVISDARCTLPMIQRIFPHHLDLPAWRRILASLGLPQECLFAQNFSRVAHVSVSDAFINLAECNDLVPDRPFLLCAQGVGGFSAAALLER
jgi:3-oxoacyl-[acyl-carrier-protein] synthase III